jgi:hypothetical protein
MRNALDAFWRYGVCIHVNAFIAMPRYFLGSLLREFRRTDAHNYGAQLTKLG